MESLTLLPFIIRCTEVVFITLTGILINSENSCSRPNKLVLSVASQKCSKFSPAVHHTCSIKRIPDSFYLYSGFFTEVPRIKIMLIRHQPLQSKSGELQFNWMLIEHLECKTRGTWRTKQNIFILQRNSWKLTGGRELPPILDLGSEGDTILFSQYFHHRVWQCTEESLWQNANIHFLYWEKEMKCKGVRSCKNNLSVLFNNIQMKYIVLKWVICQLRRVLELCFCSTAFSNRKFCFCRTNSPSHKLTLWTKVTLLQVTGEKAADRFCRRWGSCQLVQRKWRHTQNSIWADFGMSGFE